ncbi:hypothetical protein C2E25_00070 [Geothermobacter hydrogeniphilus]|uniref:Uncharacterized protein n=1 Tax=Geothermobacter hydrogeniphilus TaxID=1969733 RepID=A0A2K2HEI2_9BACT|nr:hypothetical protein [Geothermobacter hydrogeniphilus]PNU21663.1 hypothetical protein C2E25_00070 [Geothermobacter hydrogeniphilus]
MRLLNTLILALLLAGCALQSGSWEWRPVDNRTGQKVDQDIWECEIFADENDDAVVWRPANGRPYGEWGNFNFEWCMQERGWRQEFITD